MENPSEAGSGDKQRSLSESSDTVFESSIEFDPLLPEVPVITNEENEEVLLVTRARVYRFVAKEDEPREWVERGTGELKILHDTVNNSARVVMRRDKIFKVCANHFITPTMELKPCFGSDKAFHYVVAGDFTFETLRTECFAFKFRNSECANQFKEKFNEAKKIVTEKCSLYCLKDDDEDDSENDDEKVENQNDVEKVENEKDGEKKDDLSKKMKELVVEEK
nr:ran-specific GTPase-activating protein-like [Onthophagus taurus]